MPNLLPSTLAGQRLLDRILPPPADPDHITVVDAARLEAREELGAAIRAVEGEARRRRVFARYRNEWGEMVPDREGQWVHAEEIGIKEWKLDPIRPTVDHRATMHRPCPACAPDGDASRVEF